MTTDYFAYDVIKDQNGTIIGYYMTIVGLIEEGNTVKVKESLGEQGDKTLGFGRITIRNQDRRIFNFLRETNSRVHVHETGLNHQNHDVISFVVSQNRFDVATALEPGDHVLLHGRAYFRKNKQNPQGPSECSIRVTGLQKLGHVTKRASIPLSKKLSLVPQQDDTTKEQA